MCLLLLSYKFHPRYRLILAANRDEYYHRPTEPAAFWQEAPYVLAGRDAEAGGTWLGITRKGRFAALTNYRDPAAYITGAPSRGLLVRGYLLGDKAPQEYLEELKKADCNGFSVIVGDPDGAYYYSNRGGWEQVNPGLHGLSNHLFNTPWPKVIRGKEAMAALHTGQPEILPEDLFSLLSDTSKPEDSELPHTGVGLAWERLLSPRFILSPDYGTRSSTVILIDQEEKITFIERTFKGSLEILKEVRHEFQIGPGVAA